MRDAEITGNPSVKKGAPLLRVLRLVLPAIMLLVSIACVWQVSRLKDPQRAEILGGLAAALVLSLLSGWLLGRRLHRRLERKPTTLLPFILQGGILISTAVYLCTWQDDRIPMYLIVLEAAALCLFVALIVSTAYVTGHLLLPGEARIPRIRRLLLLLLLYGTALSAFGAGYFRYPRDRLRPEGPPSSPDMPYVEALEAVLTGFPPHITEKVGEKGDIWYETYARQGENVVYLGAIIEHYGPLPEEVIEADGTTAIVDGFPLELAGWSLQPPLILQPDKWRGESSEWTETVSFESPTGDSIVLQLPFHRPRYAPEQGTLHLLLKCPEEFRFSSPRVTFLLLPWGTQVDTCWPLPLRAIPVEYPPGNRALVIRDWFCSLIPGPIEVRLDIWHGGTNSYELAPREGEILKTERTAILFVKMYPGRFKVEHPDREHHALREMRGEGPCTTAVFCTVASPDVTGIYAVDAVGRDGNVYPGTFDWPERGLEGATFECSPENIEAFRITEWARLSQVRYIIPKVEGPPEENIGCDDLLDLRVPRPFFEGRWGFDMIINLAVNQCGVRGSVLFWPIEGDKVQGVPTFRDLLDHYSPGKWWVQENNLRLHERPAWRGGPLMRRIRESLREQEE